MTTTRVRCHHCTRHIALTPGGLLHPHATIARRATRPGQVSATADTCPASGSTPRWPYQPIITLTPTGDLL